MRWTSSTSRLKHWIDRCRQHDFKTHLIFAIWPKRLNHFSESPVYWLCPVSRVRKSTTWKPAGCLDLGYSSWWSYDNPPQKVWAEWFKSRSLHHLAGLINFLVYWSWYPAIVIGICYAFYSSIRG